jgi:hypothetical protein
MEKKKIRTYKKRKKAQQPAGQSVQLPLFEVEENKLTEKEVPVQPVPVVQAAEKDSAAAPGLTDSEKISKLFKITLYDKLLIIAVIIFSLLLLLPFKQAVVKDKRALVYHDGVLIEQLDLSKDGIKKIKLPGGNIKIEVKKGRVRMLDSSCPHRICVKDGWIENNGQVIVCAPNKILIEMKGINSGYDTISY